MVLVLWSDLFNPNSAVDSAKPSCIGKCVSLLLTSFQSVLVWVLFCRKIGGSEINIKMVPIGAVGLTVFALYLAASLAFVPERTGALLTLKDVLPRAGFTTMS